MKKLFIEYAVRVEVEVSDEAYEEIVDDPGVIGDYTPNLEIKASAGTVLNHEIVWVSNTETDEVLYEA